MKASTRVCVAILACVAAPLIVAANRTLEDTVTQTLVFRKIAVPVPEFDRNLATQLANQFLADHRNVKMVRLTIVPDMKPATDSLLGCDHCDPYTFWREQWDRISSVTFPVAELMSISGNAVLRYRDSKGQVTVTVLEGSDPRAVQVGSFHGIIIHVGMSGRKESPLA
jgi:hypothetical protein